MSAPGPSSSASSDVAEWLPLLGSIVQALCGGDDRPSARQTDAPRGDDQAPPDDQDA